MLYRNNISKFVKEVYKLDTKVAMSHFIVNEESNLGGKNHIARSKLISNPKHPDLEIDEDKNKFDELYLEIKGEGLFKDSSA